MKIIVVRASQNHSVPNIYIYMNQRQAAISYTLLKNLHSPTISLSMSFSKQITLYDFDIT